MYTELALPKLVCFDLSGTLIESLDIDNQAVQEICLRYGKTRTGFEEELGLKHSVRICMQQFLGESAYNEYISFLLEHNEHTKIFSNTENVLSFLKQKNVQTCLITNRCRRYTEGVTKYHNLYGYFDFMICCNDDIPVEKPNPEVLTYARNIVGIEEKSDIWFVGDSYADIEMGLQFGCVPVFFIGNCPVDRLTQLKEMYPLVVNVADYFCMLELLQHLNK
ncbi:MAG: HAD family hydrolase [Bacteroidales bacterium]|jgi:phosphoglycolate phosphatase|nr:HAD family hydrolase [Bacteroidales bacterium]